MNAAADSSTALAGIRVLDLTHDRAGSYCTKLLAGFGAEVVKVEPVGGDPLRKQGPFFADAQGRAESVPFWWLNTAKRSVVLDLAGEAGRARLLQLAGEADVLVESFSSRELADLGLADEPWRAANPGLVTASITPYGRTGPYRDFEADELELYAMCGAMHVTGEADKPPLGPGVAICQYAAGASAFTGVLLALFQRLRDGLGQRVDVAIRESAIDLIETGMADHLARGVVPRRGPHIYTPWGLFRCRDGYVTVIGAPFRHWTRGARMFEAPALLEPRLLHARDRAKHRAEVHALLQPWLDRHDAKEICSRAFEFGLAFGYLAGFDEVVGSPDHAAHNFFVPLPQGAGVGKIGGAPFRMSATPWRNGPAPELGEHRAAAFSERPPRRSAEASASDERGPLDGVCVVDLTHSWAGPHCTRLLADFGAEVILVEYPRRLGMHRGGRTEDRVYDRQPLWFQVNRGKYAVALDLKRPKDREIMADLIGHADVLVENGRSGVMDRLRLSPGELERLNPNLISVSMPAYDPQGPLSGAPAYGGAIEAVAGIQNLTAYEPGGKPQRVKELDVINGTGAAAATLLALIHRARTGQGQHIEFVQAEFSMHALIGEALLEFSMLGSAPLALGNRSRWSAPRGCYPCAGEDRWVTLTIQTEAQWERLCQALGQPELAGDARFATREARQVHHDELDRIVTAWMRERSSREAMEQLQAFGVPAGMVCTAADLCQDPQLAVRGYFQEGIDPDGNRMMGFPFQLSRGAGKVRWRGPAVGQHNEAVICGKLGRPPADLAAIHVDKIGTSYDIE